MTSLEVPIPKTDSVEGPASLPPHPELGPALDYRAKSNLLNHGGCCCSLRCLLILALGIICLMTIAVIVVSIDIRPHDEEDDFDEFFRTPEEQAKFEEEVFLLEENLRPTGFRVSKYRCVFRCSLPQFVRDENRLRLASEGSGSLITTNSTDRQKRQTDTTFPVVRHACCESRVVFINPDSAFDINNRALTVVQEENRGQYFKSYNCSHVQGCTGCGCCQGVEKHRAVVRQPNGQKRFVVTIVLPGCCKCYNNLDPNTC